MAESHASSSDVQSLDVLVIGFGSAGIAAARELKDAGANFRVLEAGDGGTSCARTACMPSKSLLAAAHLAHAIRHAHPFGFLHTEVVTPDATMVLRRVRELRDRFVAAVQEETEDLLPYVIKGSAVFESADRVKVGSSTFRAKRFIFAIGRQPVIPKAFASVRERLLTSKNIFELAAIPRQLTVIGSGPSGLEIAQAFARLGTEVTCFTHPGARIAQLEDPLVNDAVKALLAHEFPLVEDRVTGIEDAEGNRLRVIGETHAMVADHVYVALGGWVDWEGLGVARYLKINPETGEPLVNERTLALEGFPGFLAGECNLKCRSVHVAIAQGRRAAHNALCDDTQWIESDFAPSLTVTFTSPQIATVGLAFNAARERGARVLEADVATEGRALIEGKIGGRIRLYVDKDTDKILGAELACENAEHLAHQLVTAVASKMTLSQLRVLPIYHPTWEEFLQNAWGRESSGGLHM